MGMMNRFTAILLGATALVSTSAFAQDGANLRRRSCPEPKLIVAISVDQFSTDMFNEYREDFTGGLKRLAGGIAFPERLSKPCSDRNLPRPFDDPDWQPPVAYRHHRQRLVRSVARHAPGKDGKPTMASIAPKTLDGRRAATVPITPSRPICSRCQLWVTGCAR
jgi:hypothetical protein